MRGAAADTNISSPAHDALHIYVGNLLITSWFPNLEGPCIRRCRLQHPACAGAVQQEQHSCLQSALEELLLVGNPLYNEYKDKGETQAYRIEVRARSGQPSCCQAGHSGSGTGAHLGGSGLGQRSTALGDRASGG